MKAVIIIATLLLVLRSEAESAAVAASFQWRSFKMVTLSRCALKETKKRYAARLMARLERILSRHIWKTHAKNDTDNASQAKEVSKEALLIDASEEWTFPMAK